MAWRFYQGVRGEWWWYELDDAGGVTISSDRGFAELSACMLNAQARGFSGGAYQVHARSDAGTSPESPPRDVTE